MNSNELFELISEWKSKTFLYNQSLVFDKEIYEEALSVFFSDYNRWFPHDKEINVDHLILKPQLHAILTYRLARLYYLKKNDSVALILSLIGRINGQVEIFYSSNIGNGFKICHGVGSVIGARCVIGSNCTIHQNCTLGDKNSGRPTLGNNITIYPGAIIIGGIYIGNNSVVGANSLVLNSFPDNSVIVGSPAINKI